MLTRILLIALLALPLSAQGQETQKDLLAKKEEPVYKLDYVIAELEAGKRIEARDYTMLVEGNKSGRVRIGNRVPVFAGAAAGQWQYLDIGVNIDASVHHSGDSVSLTTKVEVSSAVMPRGETEKLPPQPTMRQFRTENDVVLSFGKPMVLFTLDEPNSKRSFQIQVTASLVK